VLVVDDPVHPAGRVQLKAPYGVVPPDTPAVHMNGLLEVTPLAQLTETTSGFPPTLAVVLAVALTPLPSLAVLLTENMPLEEHVTWIVLVVEVPVQPAARV